MKYSKHIFSLALMAAFICFGGRAFAQAPEVPAIAKENFAKDFPGAQASSWEVDSDEVEVEFEWGGMYMEAEYSLEGSLIRSEREILLDELPQAVKDFLNHEYPTLPFQDATEIKEGGVAFYEVELEDGANEVELLLDFQGKLIASQVEEHEIEGDDQ